MHAPVVRDTAGIAATLEKGDFAPARRAWRRRLWLALVGPPLLAMLFALSMGKHVDHDEHQFIASGALLARGGLLPYRDYPYFHVPNQTFINAALDRCTGHLLLAARSFNVACSACTVLIFIALCTRWFAPFGTTVKRTAAAFASAAVLSNPIFTFTSGKAWNHDLPVLLALLALLCLWRWRDQQQRRVVAAAWAAAAGALIGFAAGTRLTFAPPVAAFALAMLLAPGKPRAERMIGIGLLAGAAALALAPCWWLLAIAPRQFLFGNFTYPALNTLYRRQEGFTRSMTVLGKFAYIFKDLCNQPGNLLVFGSAVAFLITLRRKPGQPDHPRRFELLSLALLIGTLLIGSFAPTPLWTPYFFAPMMFAALLVAGGLADTRKTVRQALPLWRFLGACTLICAGIGALQYRDVFAMRRPSAWTATQIHAMGQEIAERCGGNGLVLTYAPIAPLEGGCSIYPEFATGPFAARVARWVPEDDEKALKAVDPDDLQELVAARPPAAILLGYEQSLEKPLRAVAATGGFQHMPSFTGEGDVARAKELWVHPATAGR